MSTFYAAFPDSVKAQQMMLRLIDDGIGLDDISLVTHGMASIEGAVTPSTGDASFFVGRTDDPPHSSVDSRTPDADYEAAEISPIGGGISTSNSGQNVDSVDQMDESQEAAEEQGWPREDTSNSRHELDDLDRAMRTGFPTPVTPIDNDFADPSTDNRSLEGIKVAGVGIVMGGGDLATAAFDWAGTNGEPDSSSVLTYLQDEGVPPEEASDLLTQFGNGGSLLAVAIVPNVDEAALEETAERYGAVTTGWFDAPRYR
jgi:hypothetical protein